ncbi:MAG: hypothetical protein P8M18_02430 [Woeseiaceae bacterium]|nr:hypothetical protein [Woeseiaceae bacterium]
MTTVFFDARKSSRSVVVKTHIAEVVAHHIDGAEIILRKCGSRY